MDARILIVDDEEVLVRILQQMLQLEFPSSLVEVAHSGEEALSCMARRAYDLIFADLRMPGFDGMELIRGVRYLDPQTAIVLMTGYGSKAVEEEAARLGVSYYIDKPFQMDDLIQTAHRLLSQQTAETNA